MKHLPTSDFLRDLARRVDADYDRGRLESIADVVDGLDAAAQASLDAAARAKIGLSDITSAGLPGSTMGLAGATITHRPDLVREQALQQGAADAGGYPPLAKTPLAGPSTHVIPGNAGTVQAPAPLHAAEPAKIGTETR